MIIKKHLDIIIPVYDEGELIIDTIKSIANNFKFKFNILICYDKDDDNTIVSINESDLDKSNIIFLKNEFKGAHGAVMSGISKSKSDFVLVMPADDNYNTINLTNMYNKMKKNNLDVLCPDRFIEPNSIINGPFIKFLIVRIVNYSLYYLALVPTKDSTNGFRFFSRKVVNNIKITSNTGFTYSIEYLLKSIERGYNIGTFPAKWIERKKGQSRFRILNWAFNYLYWYFYAFKIRLFKK